LHQNQQVVIEYLQEENRILRGKLKGQSLKLADKERRRLAVKGKTLGRKAVEE
jgi:hypothetical protein